MASCRAPHCLCLLLLALAYLNGAAGVEIDSNGGYSIVVGITDEALPTTNVPGYIDTVKDMMDNFGNLLWEISNATFHIKSVQIVVPDRLRGLMYTNVSIKATYYTADIQITLDAGVPQTENYYPCGKPGVKILLPPWFADADVVNGHYGSQSKSLLSLWFRYRFGVWEEYGYPDNPVTPYVYNVDDISHSDWLLTSCNDAELRGKYQFLDYSDGTIKTCSTDGAELMDKSCLFEPDPYQIATSSLMGFQWIESVDRLCDESTHNKLAPNRQNLYCDFRSVWEVIRSSADFEAINETMKIQFNARAVEPPEIKYDIVVQSPKPLLYILLDIEGYTDFAYQDQVYDIWVNELTKFIHGLPADIITTVVAYPNQNDSTTDLMRKMDWTLLDDAAKSKIYGILDFQEKRTSIYFDFRFPLTEVIAELKVRNHPNGAIILVLRTEGIPHLTFAQTHRMPGPLEDDFLLDLRQYGITLCAIETSVLFSPEHNATLQYLTSESGGSLGLIVESNGAGAAQQMGPVLKLVKDKLTDGLPPVHEEYEIIYKEMISDFSKKSYLIPKRNDMENLYISVSILYGRLEYIRFQLPDPSSPYFAERSEWVQINSTYVSYTYSKTIHVAEMNEDDYDSWAWELYMLMDPLYPWLADVRGMITVYGSKLRMRPTVSSSDPLINSIKAEIFTSAVDNRHFGCYSTDINAEPLAIYVKLRNEDNKPILFRNPYNLRNLSENEPPMPSTLSAHLLHLRTGTVITAVLDDDGLGADLLAGDGVYSGYIYPHLQDGYRVYVMFNDTQSRKSIDIRNTLNPIGRLLHKTQNDLEDDIEGITLNTPYSVLVESPVVLQVTEPCIDKLYIPRVMDVQVGVTEIDGEIVKVSFTVPRIVKSPTITDDDKESEVSGYYMGMAYLAKEIVNSNFTDGINQTSLEVFIVNMSYGGRTVEALVKRENNESLVFGMQLLDFRQPPTKSGTSNIARIKGWRIDPTDPGGDPLPGCDSKCVLAIALGAGLLILLLLGISLFLWRKNRTQRTQLVLLSRDEVRDFLRGHPIVKPREGKESLLSQQQQSEYLDTSERIQSLPYDSKYEIPNSKLHIDKTELLGSGTFGNVYKGYVVNLPGSSGKVLIVAVKTVKPDMDKSYFIALLDEVKLMTYIGGSHPNIVKLIGACTKNIRRCEVFLATEFCSNGNLLACLLKLNEANFKNLVDANGRLTPQENTNSEVLTTWDLIKWAREIANGMSYLGQKKIIHGDLAARNILLDSKLVAKISDFGLSKQLLQYGKYSEQSEVEVEGGGPLPWKWLSIEALKFSRFSVASDVWAYGITMWEIFSLGQSPYPGIQWSPDFINMLEKLGLRLLKPDFATETIYEIMQDCWKPEPRERPSFTELKNDLDQMIMKVAPGEYMDLQLTDTVAYQRISGFVSAYTNV